MRRLSRAGHAVAITLTLWMLIFSGNAWGAPPGRTSPAWNVPAAPPVSAASAILMDWRTGEVLYEKNAHFRRDPASTTKVLTALIVLERAKLSDTTRISRRAAYTPGSRMYLKPGEVHSVHDLLHGLLLRSGNDAAVALAEHVAGSVEGFAKLMNEKARELGARRSHFTNPHGLTDAHHFSTAYDLALITRHALRNPVFRAIVAMPERALTYEHLHRDVILANTNRLLRLLEGADGVKTGTTSAAGPCLVFSATREEQKLIGVVLRAGNRWSDAARLLTWGFDNFRLTFLGREGEVLFSAPLEGGRIRAVPAALERDLAVVLPERAPLPELQVQLHPQLKAPVRRGQRLGKAVVLAEDGTVWAEAELTASRDVPRATLLDRLYRCLLPLVRWMNR